MSKFNCPICHKEFDVDKSVVEDIVTNSKHIKSSIRGRHVEHTFIDTHYYVRHCKSCYYKKVWSIRIIDILILGGIEYRLFDPTHLVQSIFASLIIILPLFWIIICAPINRLIYKLFFELDIEYAYQHNALTKEKEK